jgi:hypothetical protein
MGRVFAHVEDMARAVRRRETLSRRDDNSRRTVQNVRGVHHELRSPRRMKMDLVVMSPSSHNLLRDRAHFLSRQLRSFFG